MASIRRTLWPAYQDRSFQNGVVSSSPSHRLFLSNAKYSSSGFFGSVAVPLRRLFLAAAANRNDFHSSLSRCLLLFIFGFLLGMFPFGYVDTDTRSRDYLSFEMKPPHVNVQLDGGDKRAGLSLNAVSVGIDAPASGVLKSDYSPRKQLIVVTPTYDRVLQAYFLNRLGQALRLVRPPLLWIVVEMETEAAETAEMLQKTGVMYRHLLCVKKNSSIDVKDRGVQQRNVALEHIERHRLDGIVYFADDDNIYSHELFESLRQISRFGTWPVAMLAQSKNKAILEGPVCNGSQVIGWHSNEKSKSLRRFHVDMSGFAFNSTILWDQKRWRRPFTNPVRQLDTVKEGFEETTFIEQVVEDESQMEALPSGCSKILNWHLHLEAQGLVYPRGWLLQKNLEVVLPIK